MHIDYYASLNSPWTHLGAARIEALAAKHGATRNSLEALRRDTLKHG